jgi:hypothetical protein
MNPYYHQPTAANPLELIGAMLETLITRVQRREADIAAAEQRAAEAAFAAQRHREEITAAQHALTRRRAFNDAMLELQYRATLKSCHKYRDMWGLAPPSDSRWDSLATIQAWYSVPNQRSDVGRNLILSLGCDCDFGYCQGFCAGIGEIEKQFGATDEHDTRKDSGNAGVAK